MHIVASSDNLRKLSTILAEKVHVSIHDVSGYIDALLRYLGRTKEDLSGVRCGGDHGRKTLKYSMTFIWKKGHTDAGTSQFGVTNVCHTYMLLNKLSSLRRSDLQIFSY